MALGTALFFNDLDGVYGLHFFAANGCLKLEHFKVRIHLRAVKLVSRLRLRLRLVDLFDHVVKTDGSIRGLNRTV